jgi:hypothetical protein
VSFEAAHNGCVVGVASSGTCVDDDVDRGQLMLVMSKRFADQTLQVIAPHSPADDAGRNRQSQTSMWDIIATNENCEERIGETSRILIDAVEVRFVMEALRRSERPGESLQVTLRTRSSRPVR